MDTASRFLQNLGDSVFKIRWFFWRSNVLCLRFVNFFNICATIVIDRPEDTFEGCDLQGSFADDIYVLIGPSCGSVFCVPPRSYFGVLHVIHCPTLTFDRLLLRNTTPYYCALYSLYVYLEVCTKGTKGTLDVIIISLINLVAGLLHYFLLDRAYK